MPVPPRLRGIDHVHVFVADRAAAETWYGRVLGLRRIERLAFWAAGGGPLTLADTSDTVHLALFESPARPCRSTVALGVGAEELLAWQEHLRGCLGVEPRLDDHGVSWSIYFTDPDGNPFEITTNAHAAFAQLSGRH